MKTKTFLMCLLLATLVVGFPALRDRVDAVRQDHAAEPAARFAASRAMNDDDDESLPVIDFAMLDQARTLDLIDDDLEFPESLMKLDGQRVILIGFMAPYDDLNNMRRCMIMPSYVGCSFCSPPSMTQVVYVNQGAANARPRSYRFIEPPSHVNGILRLSLPGRDHEGQRNGFIYSIEDATVTPHTGKALERLAGHEAGAHEPRTGPLEPVATAELVEDVAELIGRAPIQPIEVERVTADTFGQARSRATGEDLPRIQPGRAHACVRDARFVPGRGRLAQRHDGVPAGSACGDGGRRRTTHCAVGFRP